MKRILSYLFLFALSLPPVLASGTIVPTPKRQADIMPRPRPPRIIAQPLEVRSLKVDVTLNERLAETEVEQVFYNPGGRMEEGTWLFPLPANAQIKDFTMFINGVETRGELLDAKQAAGIYRRIVRSMRDPALLEYMGTGLLRASVFPIEARSEKRIRLKYRQVLEKDESLINYRYPLGRSRFASQRIGSLAVKVTVNTATRTLYSPSHDFEIVRKENRSVMSFEAENHQPERDIDILFSRSGKKAFGVDMLTTTFRGDRFFWMTVAPEWANRKALPKDLVLILDTSGSMTNRKLEQARNALNFCLDNLDKRDRFEIIRFSTGAEPFAGKLLPATREHLDDAREFIAGFKPIGGTNMQDAFDMAFQLEPDTGRPRVIVFITDGKPTIGETDNRRLLELIEKNNQHDFRIFPFGIGTKINTHLLEKMALAHGGRHAYALPDEDLELKLSSFYSKIGSPVLGDPRIKVSGVRIHDQHPNRLPDLFKGSALHIFGRYTGSGAATIELTGKSNGKEQTFTYEVDFPKWDRNNDFIPELWAQRRVAWLLEQIRLNGESKEVRDEVVTLARRYRIITPYTSFLILEDDRDLNAVVRRRFLERESRDAPVQEEAQAPRVHERARKKYDALRQESGIDSVAAGRELKVMGESQVQTAAPTAKYAKTDGKSRQDTVFANGRAFYLLDGVWTDSLLKRGQAAQKSLAFGEDAYFALLEKEPGLGDIFALGEKVRFLFNETVYEIVP